MGLSGGNRVVLELANRLQQKGHEVSITCVEPWEAKDQTGYWSGNKTAKINIYSANFPSNKLKRLTQILFFKQTIYDKLESVLIKNIPGCDINIATFSLTAEATLKSNKGKMFYLVQHYEPWLLENEKLKVKAEKSYSLPMTKLCVSHWLAEKVGGVYIGNGVNTVTFHTYQLFSEKEPFSVLYLYRGIAWKGDDIALATLEKLYVENPEVKIHIVTRPDSKIDVKFHFTRHDTLSDIELAKLYSKVKVLLYASKFEGYALPPIEAFACGTNVVSTSFQGNEYLVDGKNCFLGDSPQKLAERINLLFNDEKLAFKQLAEAASVVKAHDFDVVTEKVMKAFNEKKQGEN
jgi:glycosyltransferase involved in cell wall biosynthesis